MTKERLAAFSDAVIAIIITIMVLELKAPHGATLEALRPLIPIFLSYVLSFMYLSIYWNNHHHLFQAVEHVNGKILWANMHLLFWLSLIPFTTAWMGENHFAAMPVALYGVVLLFAASAYFILSKILLTHHSRNSLIAKALKNDLKDRLSVVLYASAILLALTMPLLACSIYILVAILWLIPDKRIENVLEK